MLASNKKMPKTFETIIFWIILSPVFCLPRNINVFDFVSPLITLKGCVGDKKTLTHSCAVYFRSVTHMQANLMFQHLHTSNSVFISTGRWVHVRWKITILFRFYCRVNPTRRCLLYRYVRMFVSSMLRMRIVSGKTNVLHYKV